MITHWQRAILLLAAIKVGTSVAGFFEFPVVQNPATPFPPWLFFANVIVFALTALFLLFAAYDDQRAIYLSAFFLITASAFSPVGGDSLPGFFQLLRFLRTDAFWPFFLWLFVSEFPSSFVSARIAAAQRFMIRSSAIAGFMLFAMNALRLIDHGYEPVDRMLAAFNRTSATSFYWAIWFVLALPAIPFIAWKAKWARPVERRRVHLFIAGIVAGTAPLIVAVLVDFVFFLPPSLLRAAGYVVYPALLSVPVTTTYSVIVHRVLDVKLIIRKGLQYALARYTLLGLTALPFIALLVYFIDHREEPLVVIFSNTPRSLVAATAVGLVALRFGHHVFDALDQWFFRQQYDARTILSTLIERSREVQSLQELANLLQLKIDSAFHLERIEIFLNDVHGGRLVSTNGAIRPLDVTSSLAVAMSASGRPAEVDLKNDRSMFANLSLEDQQWLVDGAYQLLVPVVGSDGRLLALIGLGEKKSELPFSGEDRQLLSAIASSTALTLESHQWLIHAIKNSDEPASECTACGGIYAPGAASCHQCNTATKPAAVPYVLLRKFRFQKRLGSGGSGVVYRAIDLNLGTYVAIKTLPRLSPQEAIRLRSEARLIASFRHAHLVEIRGFETWHGIPMLVFEYLDGGTLADRLRREPLSLQETLETGVILSNVLEYIHARGVFHLDIKPSNIGYSRTTLKVLDFGVARIQPTHHQRLVLTGGDSEQTTPSFTETDDQSDSGAIVGTPAYWPPEVLRGAAQTSAFDLWAAALVLYECMTRRNPMLKETLQGTIQALRSAHVPDIRTYLPHCPDLVAAFFSSALSGRVSRRPATARAMKHYLEELKS